MSVDPIKLHCCKVLPLIFDEALSYYEVLCKVKDAVNGLISELDDVEADVAQLQSDVSSLSTNMTQVQTAITAQNVRLGALETDNTSNKSNISTLQANVVSLQSNLNTLAGRVTNLEKGAVIKCYLEDDDVSTITLESGSLADGIKMIDVISYPPDTLSSTLIHSKVTGATISPYNSTSSDYVVTFIGVIRSDLIKVTLYWDGTSETFDETKSAAAVIS